jgi:flagellar hook assembly protein FlgD
LNQNTPNPFNPTTVIEFAVPEPSEVSLCVYDAKGKLVRTVIDTRVEAPSTLRAPWDGRDDKGKLVPSGVYFYKLVAGDRSATRKMLLLK